MSTTTTTPTHTRRLVLAEPPGIPIDTAKSFRLEQSVPLALPLQQNQVLLAVRYISNDPAQHGWMQADADPARTYARLTPRGEPIPCMAVAEVLQSTSSSLQEGQLVTGQLGWYEHVVVDAAKCTPIPANDIEPSHFIGALGLTGLTALHGLRVGETSSKDRVLVVSGAAGATGSMVVQLAKRVHGVSKVIGIAGSAAKCKWVVEQLGADACVDYKAADFADQLKAATGRQVDVYFDNVGGEILDLLLTCMRQNGRIVACGGISRYSSSTDPTAGMIKNWMQIVAMRLQVRGFIIFDVAAEYGRMTETLVGYYREGKINLTQEVQTLIESNLEGVPEVWSRLYVGGNMGKLITKLV